MYWLEKLFCSKKGKENRVEKQRGLFDCYSTIIEILDRCAPFAIGRIGRRSGFFMAHLGWLILPPRLSQKRRGRNGIAVKSSFLPKRRDAYRSLGVTADREIHPRDHPFFSPIFHSSVKRTIVTHHPIPATRTITFAIPRFLGTETKRSCREIRSEILLSCWYLLIARDRFALLISPMKFLLPLCISNLTFI